MESLCIIVFLAFHLIFIVVADDNVVKKTIHVGGKKDEHGFTEEEKFQDIFELTEDDFEEKVFETSDPWIVLFHNGMLDKKWKTLAVAMRGIVWFGSIHRLQQEDLIDDIKYPVKLSPPARVYPWGSTKMKRKWRDVETPEEAKSLVIQSIPDPTTKTSPDDLHEFLFDSYSTVPSRLPVIFFIKGDTVTPLFKSVALHYNKYFNFGTIHNPTKADYATFQYNLGLPGMIILAAKDFATTDPDERVTPDYDFNVISYSPDKQGSLDYPNMVKFLYGINHQFRNTLPGMNLATEDEIIEMEEEMDIEKLRFNVRYVDKLREVVTYDPLTVKVKKSHTKSDKKSEGAKKEKKPKLKKGDEKLSKDNQEKDVPPERYEEKKFGIKSGKEGKDEL